LTHTTARGIGPLSDTILSATIQYLTWKKQNASDDCDDPENVLNEAQNGAFIIKRTREQLKQKRILEAEISPYIDTRTLQELADVTQDVYAREARKVLNVRKPPEYDLACGKDRR
jgi:hypothetical protein